MRRPTVKQLENTVPIDFRSSSEVAVKKPRQKDAKPLGLLKGDVFDKLSKRLALQAAELEAADAKLENTYRPKIIIALQGLATGQSDVGEMLDLYSGIYKGERKWTSVAKDLGKAINCSARTIFRMLDEYRARNEPERNKHTHGPKLPTQDRREQGARMAIRVFLNNIPHNRKLRALADLLAEEAYQVWGKRELFTIEVNPRPSSFTIDGRKRTVPLQSGEVAA